MDTICFADLVHTKFKKPFSTASGSCSEKDTVLLGYEDGERWELTWSPSMGVSAHSVFHALQARELDSAIRSFLLSHLCWEAVASELSTSGKKPCIFVEEVGVRERAPRLHEGVGLLRVKCSKVVPEWLYNCVLPDYLVLDFNGSADATKLDCDMHAFVADHPDVDVFVEQPYRGILPSKIGGARVILDTDGYIDMINAGLVFPGSVAIFKLGRNTVEEYTALCKLGVNCLFGSVLCTNDAYQKIVKLNDGLGNLRLRTLYRDGIKIDDAVSPISVETIETTCVKDFFERNVSMSEIFGVNMYCL